MDEENENLEELENESTPNEENIPTEIEAEPPKNELLAIGEKKVINTLLKINPWWWVFFGGFLAIILLLILMVSINQESGGNDLYYKEGACTTVTVKYEPYNEKEPSSTLQMDIETYVQSAAVEYMKDLIEHEDETAVIQVYYALTIALRTEAVSNNCTVTYKDKQLSKNPSTNDYLETVLKETKGVILGDKDHNVISDAHVSDFCWYNVNDNQEEYKIYPKDTLSVSNYFVNNYVDNEIYKKCPCNDPQGSYYDSEWGMCWTRWQTNEDKANEEPEYEYAWLHDDDEAGFSVVGAYNLMRYNVEKTDESEKDNGYDYNLILKYFYGQDITYMTVNKDTVKNNLPTQVCSSDSLPYNSTPLSRDEFISAVTNFLSSGNYASWVQNFIDNAGAIYDMGQEKNINPELIYIFARKETSFKTNDTNTKHYNYYGYGVYNGQSVGKLFSNFMEGVETLYDWFVKAGSMHGIVQKYSYLGTYLANPGSSGSGGCYYLKIIYGENYSRCASSYKCSSVNGGAGCVLTTDEERNAYLDWQAEKYLVHRKDIFNLSGTVCKGSVIQTDANLTIPKNMMKESLSSYLNSQGLSIQDLNDTIYNNVVDKGVGTRAGVATAATTLINYMQQFDVRIPYTYGGGHSSIKGVGRATANLFGVDPDWGTPIGAYWTSGMGPYTHYGPDCSAFVYWVLHNGGVKVSFGSSANMKNYGPTHASDGSYIGQVGDVLVSSGHVSIIVGINEEESYYIVAESNGLSSGYRPDTKGISYQKIGFVNNYYSVVDMSSYYNDATKHYSEEEYSTAFANGRLG